MKTPSLAKRVLRDMVSAEVEKIRVDSREVFDALTTFGNKFNPDIVRLLEHYPGERPLFYMYSIEDEISKALERKVMLKSGGHLVFDQTEAMSIVDVNTGAYVGHRNLEETIYKTNLEAAVGDCPTIADTQISAALSLLILSTCRVQNIGARFFVLSKRL